MEAPVPENSASTVQILSMLSSSFVIQNLHHTIYSILIAYGSIEEQEFLFHTFTWGIKQKTDLLECNAEVYLLYTVFSLGLFCEVS